MTGDEEEGGLTLRQRWKTEESVFREALREAEAFRAEHHMTFREGPKEVRFDRRRGWHLGFSVSIGPEVEPLGHDHSEYCYRSSFTGLVHVFRAGDHVRPKLLRLAPEGWWGWRNCIPWIGENDGGWLAVASVLMSGCHQAGIYPLRTLLDARKYNIRGGGYDDVDCPDPAQVEFAWRGSSRRRSGISLRLRFAILKRDGYRCQLCGRSAQDGARLEVDHREPVAVGGPDDPDNLWTLCFECNRGKSDDGL